MKHLALWNLRLAVAAVAASAGLLAIYRSTLPPLVPLWYSRPWGEDQLASPYWLWLVPILVAVVAFLAWWGEKRLHRDPLLAGVWLVSGMVAEVIMSLGVIRIVWLMIF